MVVGFTDEDEVRAEFEDQLAEGLAAEEVFAEGLKDCPECIVPMSHTYRCTFTHETTNCPSQPAASNASTMQ